MQAGVYHGINLTEEPPTITVVLLNGQEIQVPFNAGQAAMDLKFDCYKRGQ